MSLGKSSADDVRKNASALVKRCQLKLATSGFVDRKGTTLWRRTNLKFDILKFDVFPRVRCEKWRVPPGSFGLEPSCLFLFLPRVSYSPDDWLKPNKGFGQVRLSIRQPGAQRSVEAPKVWWVGDEVGIFEDVMRDVLDTISKKVLPFFRRFEDPEELLRTLLEDEDATGREGVWDIGKKGSPHRLLYTGFAAIECGKWDLAASSLETCNERLRSIPEPIGRSVRAESVPYLNEGLVCIRNKRSWSIAQGIKEYRQAED